MDRKIIRTPGVSERLEKARVPLSPAVKAGGFVFVSGTPPFDRVNGGFVSGTIVEQGRGRLENIKATLERAGSSMEKAAKVVVFSTDGTIFNEFNDDVPGIFPTDPPARTFIEVGP